MRDKTLKNLPDLKFCAQRIYGWNMHAVERFEVDTDIKKLVQIKRIEVYNDSGNVVNINGTDDLLYKIRHKKLIFTRKPGGVFDQQEYNDNSCLRIWIEYFCKQ